MTQHSTPVETRWDSMRPGGRKTVYKGVEMRSRTEAGFAAYLDRTLAPPARWEYEPCAFGDEHGQYLPDFRLTCGTKKPVYVEVKSATWAGDPLELAERMKVIWSSEPDCYLMLAIYGCRPRVWDGGYWMLTLWATWSDEYWKAQ